jgi:hypothetical protein
MINASLPCFNFFIQNKEMLIFLFFYFFIFIYISMHSALSRDLENILVSIRRLQSSPWVEEGGKTDRTPMTPWKSSKIPLISYHNLGVFHAAL